MEKHCISNSQKLNLSSIKWKNFGVLITVRWKNCFLLKATPVRHPLFCKLLQKKILGQKRMIKNTVICRIWRIWFSSKFQTSESMSLYQRFFSSALSHQFSLTTLINTNTAINISILLCAIHLTSTRRLLHPLHICHLLRWGHS